jgi:hypothetical protein
LQGKETESHNYSNEVRLVNYILKGKFESLDRNSLSKEELDRLFFLEQNNSALMGAGVEYAKRKAILKTMLLNKYPVLT